MVQQRRSEKVKDFLKGFCSLRTCVSNEPK